MDKDSSSKDVPVLVPEEEIDIVEDLVYKLKLLFLLEELLVGPDKYKIVLIVQLILDTEGIMLESLISTSFL